MAPGPKYRQVELRQLKMKQYLKYKKNGVGLLGFIYVPPLPGPVWLTTLNAVDDSILCPQAIMPGFTELGKIIREDCLIANIYTPNSNETNIPVVVIIHGGGFQLGWGNFRTPKKLVKSQNVIAVTFNYRLGIHGFLCLGTEGAPGNAGLKDQLTLLRWVKANIAGFGGNPNDVTINGYSAGSASVELLMLMPAAKDLFTKAIPESSSAFSAFAVQTDPLEIAKEFARRFNVSNIDNVFSLEQFFKTASFQVITSDTFQDRKDSTFLFAPCIERATGVDPVLTDSPDHIIKTGNYRKVPVLYGFDDMEGQLRVPSFLSWITPMNEKFSDFIPANLRFGTKNEKYTVAKQMKKFYFGNKTIDKTRILSYVNFFSDIFIYPYIKGSKLYLESGHTRIYLYEYSFYDNNTMPLPFTDVRGAGHTAQSDAVLDEDEDNISEEYKNMKNIMRQLWGELYQKRSPLPGPSWLTTLEAVDDTIVCPQTIMPDALNYYVGKNMRENCLIANVYTPNTNATNIPVVVYIHGGAFQIGYGNFIYPKKLVKSQNIIVVTFNYRLGIHGFLCLGTEVAPGNAGIKDQVALLHWVKDNIRNFGGNPNDVAIDGYSAGSASAELLMISPATKGLFTKVALDSSSVLAAYSIQTDPLKTSQDFAKRYNVSVNNIIALENFYKNATFQIITSGSSLLRPDFLFAFSPCVERLKGRDAILTDSPYNILKSRKYDKFPILYGFDNMEGILLLPLFLFWKDPMNSVFSEFILPDLQFNDDNEKKKVAMQIKNFYFGSKSVNETTILAYIDYFSDFIIYPIYRAANMYVKNGHDQIYFYEYIFTDNNTAPIPFTNVRGARHGAQTEAVLDGVEENTKSEEERNMRRIMRELWGNFFKTGAPVPAGSTLAAWPPTGKNATLSPYMSLGQKIELLYDPILAKRPVWLTTLEAVDDTIICPQNVMPNIANLYLGKNIQEDCLIANIYVPNTSATNLPVVVIVHGGGYQIGYGNFMKPMKLVRTQKVIVLTFNYRLGIHGFLCLGTKDAPGNAGIKDMVAMLRWVKANIVNFGGNPNDVTIDGYSAGAAGVELLMLSSTTKGLFNKIITESSSTLTAYAVQIDPLADAKEFARRYNVSDVNNVYALEKFYKTATFQMITSDGFQDRKDSTFLFTPCVERPGGLDPFLTDSPYNIIKSGKFQKIPMLYGFDIMEGLFRLVLFPFWKNPMNQNFEDFVPNDLQFISNNEKKNVAKQLKEFYFGNKTVDESTILLYTDFFSDIVIYPMIRAAKMYVDKGHDKLFLYEYSFYDNDTAVIPFTDVHGVGHLAQTEALLDKGSEDNLSDEYKNNKRIVRELWGNFIKTGVPVPAGSSLPSWSPFGIGASPYMSIGRKLELVNRSYNEERINFWDNLYKKYYKPPSPPQFFNLFNLG
ncbi:hypothetical protein ACJJTC_010283 [Scirpophaga incertulas]